MNTQSSPDDAARRIFLTQIELLLSLSSIAWTSIEYHTLPISKSIGLVVTAPGMSREAQILAVSIYGESAMDYVRFPGEGVPHYQLLVGDEQGGSAGYRVSCDPTAIVSSLCAWATSRQAPMKRTLAPLNEHDLLPLRRRAMIQASIQQRAQALLARGVERCGEIMMDEFGLIHDHTLSQLTQELTNSGRERLEADLHHLARRTDVFHWMLRFCLHRMSLIFPRGEVGRCGWLRMGRSDAVIGRVLHSLLSHSLVRIMPIVGIRHVGCGM